MRDVPECLSRRYKALDELIQELSAMASTHSIQSYRNGSKDPGVKLMCEFWNILKADPNINLVNAVKTRMSMKASNSSMFGPRHVSCYMAHESSDDHSNSSMNKKRSKITKTAACSKRAKNICCDTDPNEDTCCDSPLSIQTIDKSSLPLSKVLCTLKEAASFDKKCNDKITDLMQTQNLLRDQIQQLEQREKEGAELLKQADCMWSCMEASYKAKLEASQKRQKELMKELREVEINNAKWRKNKKDFESQMNSLNKCHRDINEKIAQKNNDATYLDKEIADFQKRIDKNKKEIEAVRKSMVNRKTASDNKIMSYNTQISKLTQLLKDEYKLKAKKEEEGTQYVKEAREELQKICRVQLQKKLENEDLRAEKEALKGEIELLNQTMDLCKERCSNKHSKLKEEIGIIDKEIADYKFQCVQCHKCIDTSDVRKMCTDCPRCMEERECLTCAEDGHCELDHGMDCICMTVKRKFLDNVFENMYTVLARQATTKPGKAVAEAVVRCLRSSTNGKLDQETRRILQDFILTTVKRNLNLTVIGGAVKTRCEMDSDTYNQLMLCLKQVKAVKPPKEDKSTPAKKEPCHRWGGTSECNCPKGPKSCICTKRAPPSVGDKGPLPPPDPDDDPGDIVKCPHKSTTACGPECGMRTHTTSAVDTEVSWKRDPCKPPCTFSTNMRAAQCMLGSERLCEPKNTMTHAPILPPKVFADLIKTFNRKATKPIVCSSDRRSRPRERIIAEVMGKYNDVSSIDKVAPPDKRSKVKRMDKTIRCVCSNSNSKEMSPHTSKLSPNLPSECSSRWIILEGTDALKDMLLKKNVPYVCKTERESPIIEPEIYESSETEVPNGFKNECDARLTVLLHPRFHPARNCNETDNNRSFETISGSRGNDNDHAKNSNDCIISQSKNQRKTHICGIAKKYINDVIVPDIKKEKVDPAVEWMTVDSLLKQITPGAEIYKDNISNETNNETEIASEPSEMKKFCNKSIKMERTQSMRIKVSNNSIKQLKTRSTQTCLIKRYSF